MPDETSGEGAAAPQAPHDLSAQMQAVLAKLQELSALTAEFRQFKEQSTAELRQFKEQSAAEFRELKEQSAAEFRLFKEETKAEFRESKDETKAEFRKLKEQNAAEFGELKEQFDDQQRYVERLALDARVNREHERRIAGDGRYQRASVPPDTETNGNGHTTYPWHQRIATPRAG